MKSSVPTTRRYILRCAHEHNDFRIPEIMSLVKLFNISLKWIEKHTVEPFCIVEVPCEEDIKKLMSRTVVVISAFELWARAKTYEEIHEQVKALPTSFVESFSSPDHSFRFQVEGFNKRLGSTEKVNKIEEFCYLPFKGSIKLNNPDHSFHLFEYYGDDPNTAPEKPYDVLFGRWICNGQRDKVDKLSLKKRKYIGNTSMDAQLSLIMCNQALVRPSFLVLDPFVGTGSMLVAAAYFGAFVLGMDIDYLTLHGKIRPTRAKQKEREHDESVKSNLEQYGLGSHYLDVLIGDSALPVWKEEPLFDAILADPPYGIRESTERIGTYKNYRIKNEHLKTHIPSKMEYNLRDIITDLLNYSALHLVIGGRLVYWLPVYNADYTEESIPSHPSFQLVSVSRQPLSAHSSRCLITMEKVSHETDCEDAVVHEATSMFRDRYFNSFENTLTE